MEIFWVKNSCDYERESERNICALVFAFIEENLFPMCVPQTFFESPFSLNGRASYHPSLFIFLSHFLGVLHSFNSLSQLSVSFEAPILSISRHLSVRISSVPPSLSSVYVSVSLHLLVLLLHWTTLSPLLSQCPFHLCPLPHSTRVAISIFII